MEDESARARGSAAKSEDGGVVQRIGSGDVFLPVGGAVAIGVGIGGGERAGDCSEILETPIVRNAVVPTGAGASQTIVIKPSWTVEWKSAIPLGEAEK